MFRPRRREGVALAAAIALLAFAGCGSSDKSEGTASAPATSAAASTTSAPKDLRVAYVPGISPFPYFDTAVRGVKEAAAERGWTVDYVAVPAYDPAAQTKALNAVLAQKPDALLVSPVDPVALRAPIQRFVKAGIPVITVGGALKDPSGLVAAIITDNYQGGVIAGEGLGRLLKDKSGSVAIIGLVPGDPLFDERVQGFVDGLKKTAPNAKPLPVEYAGADPSASQTKMRALLLAHPDMIGAYGVAEVNGEGAAAAIKALGKSGEIPVATFDGSPAEVKALRDGTLQLLSVSQPYKQGRLGIELLERHLSGDTDIPELTKIGNIEVTKENVDDPEVQQTLYTSGD